MLYINYSLLVFSSLVYSCYNSFVSFFKKKKNKHVFKLLHKVGVVSLDSLLYILIFVLKIFIKPPGKIVLFHCVASPSSSSHSFILVFEQKWEEKKELVTTQLRICQCFHYKQFVRILCNSAVKIFSGLELGIQGFSKLCRQPGSLVQWRCKRVCAHSEVSVGDRTVTSLFPEELSQFFDK